MGSKEKTEKIAILGRRDIQGYQGHGGSKGRLEKALDQGYTVIVVCNGRDFGMYDLWWLELLDKGNVFRPSPRDPNSQYPDRIAEWREAWEKIFKRFGVEFPALREEVNDRRSWNNPYSIAEEFFPNWANTKRL